MGTHLIDDLEALRTSDRFREAIIVCRFARASNALPRRISAMMMMIAS